ncbi:MAG: hypothetical protein PWP27_7 [Clostridiales bacterium]|jgi:uncharacterized protein YrzB (UPF0473 family)|nr:hypothetical protein [Clostridiales bacterium]MDK2932197.1 hypothetical protein [Clostridiales bacterium]
MRAKEVNSMTEERDGIIVLVDENGEEIEFEHLDTITMNNSNYVVLLPLDEDQDDEIEEVVILKVVEDENGDDTLVPVEDEEELNEVFEEFKIRMEGEFDFIEEEE